VTAARANQRRSTHLVHGLDVVDVNVAHFKALELVVDRVLDHEARVRHVL
jgi:hypothetical protein